MKNLYLIAIVLLILLGCTKDDELINSNRIVLLKVDYMTEVFEGGKEIILSNNSPDTDTLPINVIYYPPGDFGNITLYYQPTNEMIFDGSIIWMGTGHINFPEEFDSAESFSKLETEIEQPEISEFQIIFYELNYQPIDYTEIWSAINKLEIVSDYLKSNKKIGLFLYTPSVGVGDPNEWDWFVIMNK